ncbi:cytochrome p450 [Holotrichia oblita]|uniref:Cytochrome p450 n=1 Tax=Holotrichia oblita TaxID=644536 RepID=A0ACB9TXH0_HOLOL|nr:cytochrome p450 [Holotrichia oblita]
MTVLQYVIAGLVLGVSVVYLYFKWLYSYWRKRNVSYITPRFLLGNLEYPWAVKRGFVGTLADAYKEFKSQGKKFGGLFVLYKPTFMPVDPAMIKRMITIDFQYFMNHGNFIDEKIDPLSANLLNLEDEKWKTLRTKLTPTFTSGKIKVMYDEMKSCGTQMVEHITTLSSEHKPLDIKEIISCYSVDIIGSCAFGIDCNSFKNPDAEFRKYGRMVTEMDFWTALRMFAIFFLPEVKKLFRIRSFRPDVEKFFTNAFKDVLNHRLATNSKRNDFVQILLELGSGHGGSTKGLTTEEMLAQSVIFFGAGFETSSTNLSFCLYELAWHQDIQQRLREEILEVLNRYDGEITYEAIMDMKYMDHVLDESLRKYPPVPFLNRKCGKDYKVPETDLILEKGTSVMISVTGLQMDPDHFPNPEKFDPERFSKENKSKIIPFTFLPFGDGPRVCIEQNWFMFDTKEFPDYAEREYT